MRTAVFALAIASALVFVPTSAFADDTPAAEVAQARAQIEATIVQMRATTSRVRDELRIARRRGTKSQIACVDEALSRSDVALRRARELGDAALAAYASGEPEAAHARLERLVELREAQRMAAAEGAYCTPVVTIAVAGPTTVKLRVDPKIAPAP